MANRIDTVTGRNKLKIRREPYWHRISKGFHVGFRKMSGTSSGTWLFRYRNENGSENEISMGTLDDCPAHERFDKAVMKARDWQSRQSTNGIDVPRQDMTLWDACSGYVKRIEELKGPKAAQELEGRFRRWVKPDPIHAIALVKLAREHLYQFRKRLVDASVIVNTAGDTRPRSKDTVNRDMAAVRAALNQALADRHVLSDFAWAEPLKAFENVSRRRTLYLDRQQRARLVQHAPEHLAAFLRGLSMLPLRPGALAALTVDDFDSRLSVLKIGKDKSGQDRRIKLPTAIARIFATAAQHRDPAAPLLARWDGQAWNKDSWKGPIKDAAKKAGLPATSTAYTLRHSVITDLVHGGLDLLTVAQISGTSVAMIEKHYGHLRSDVAAKALAKLVL